VLGSTKEQRDNRRHLWSGAPDCPVCHRTCPVHQRTPTPNPSPSGNSRGNSTIIHRTIRCTPDMSGAPRKGGLRNSPVSGFQNACSAIIHRTCPVYTGLSGVPPDGVQCTTGQCPMHQRTPSQTHHLRENPEALHYNSPDCPVYTGQCPVPQGRAALELASLGKMLRYNSPDCPVSQWSNGYFAPTVTCRRI
jgi:hypothetical protein